MACEGDIADRKASRGLRRSTTTWPRGCIATWGLKRGLADFASVRDDLERWIEDRRRLAGVT
jgi:hypothetical protein